MSMGEAGFGGGLGYHGNDSFKRDDTNDKARYYDAAASMAGKLQESFKKTNSVGFVASAQANANNSSGSTLAEKIAPTQSFKAPPINSATLAATTSVAQNKSNHQAIGVVEKQVEHIQQGLDKTMTTARNMLADEVGNVAESQGLSRSAAMSSVAAPEKSDALSAGVSVLLETKGGAAGSVMEIAQNIGGDLKKLEPGVVDGLVQQALQNLSDQSKKQNIEVETQVGLKQAKPQFQNLTFKDAKDLLNNNWKNEKEYMALETAKETLDELRDENEIADAKIKRENPAPANEGLALTANAVFSLTDFSARGATFKVPALNFLDETQRVSATLNDPSLKESVAVYANELDINQVLGVGKPGLSTSF